MVTANDKAKAGEKKDKPKRTVLSPAEKIAKAEAELKRLREQAHDKDRKVVAKADEELKKLIAKREELNSKITELEASKQAAQSRIEGPVTDGVGEADSDA